MLTQCIEGLNLQPGGVYVDATYGGGGHARAILDEMEGGVLIAFDQDADALSQLAEDERLVFVPANFRYLSHWLDYLGYGPVDGVLADLGVSSHQLNQPERGFAYKFDSPLDMRMNTLSERSVADIIGELDAEELQSVLSRYGEIRNAKTLAQALVDHKKSQDFSRSSDLNQVIEKCARGAKHRYFAQVYQALRIELNDEMGALDDFLLALNDWVRPGGRLVAMSYHSLEDRIVKRFFRAGNHTGEVEKDFYGHEQSPIESLSDGIIRPSDEEIDRNPAARSAKMRVAQKIEGV
jgi:16S rRNA (cytosine1402-N4)-methyltransferase